MEYRPLGRTGWNVSSISFGAWAIGGTWGAVDDRESLAALNRALDRGVNFFDTADVYGDGHSEKLLARLRRERRDPFYIATKAGKRLKPFVAEGFNRENLTAFVERSLKNLETPRAGSAAAALPAVGRLLPARGVRDPRRSGLGREGAVLRRQRRARRGRAEGDRISRRSVGADHLQHVPAAARPSCSSPRPSAVASGSSRACRCRRVCSPAS